MYYKNCDGNCMALKLPILCPLILLVKVAWRQGIVDCLVMQQMKEVGCLG
jgi:hypothetical protein